MASLDALGIALRPAVDADAPCLSALATQVFLDTYAPDGVSPAIAREVLHELSITAVRAMLGEPSTRFMLAARGEHLVGFVQLRLGATHAAVDAARASSEVARLYVQRRFASRGIGSVLLAQAERTAAAHGSSIAWLTAWEGNAPAHAFYERRGYAFAGMSDFVFEDRHYPNRLYAKALRA